MSDLRIGRRPIIVVSPCSEEGCVCDPGEPVHKCGCCGLCFCGQHCSQGTWGIAGMEDAFLCVECQTEWNQNQAEGPQY